MGSDSAGRPCLTHSSHPSPHCDRAPRAAGAQADSTTQLVKMQEPAWYELLPIPAEGMVSATSWSPVPLSVRQERRTTIVGDTAVAGRRECVAMRKWKGANSSVQGGKPIKKWIKGSMISGSNPTQLSFQLVKMSLRKAYNHVWWCTPLITALGKQRLADL